MKYYEIRTGQKSLFLQQLYLQYFDIFRNIVNAFVKKHNHLFWTLIELRKNCDLFSPETREDVLFAVTSNVN